MSRTTIRVVRKSRGAESAASSDSSASLGRCLPPASGCPLSLQPATNLALVCRFLSARDLLSAYKVSRALSAAASSPLTFQHEREWSIDHADKGVETIGPAAVCTGEARLKAAMQSRLFRAFRILKIRAGSTAEIDSMLALLQSPSAPVLHVLQLEWTFPEPQTLHAFPASMSFPFVSVLSLLSVHSLSWPVGALHFPFPRLQVLETQFPYLLRSMLPMLQRPQITSTLRHIVMRSLTDHPANALPSDVSPGLRLMLDLESSLPELAEIHWVQPLEARSFNVEVRRWKAEHANAMPQLHKVRSAHCLAVVGGTEAPVLDVFPELEEFLLSALANPWNNNTTDDLCMPRRLLSQQTALSRLRRFTLRHIGDGHGDVMQSPRRGFDLAFAAMPLLESIDMGSFAVPLSAFAHVPRLHTLSMLFLGGCHDDASFSMDRCLPSLTALHMPFDPASRVFYSAVSRMPKLQTVQVGNLAPRPRDDFVRDGLAVLTAFETKNAKLESEALKATGWTQTVGSSETADAAAAAAFAHAPASVPSFTSDLTLSLKNTNTFSTGKAAHASKSKGEKHSAAAAAATMPTAQPFPPLSATPFSFGPLPAAAAPSAFPAFDFSSLSSALPAPSAAAPSFPAATAPSFAIAVPNAAPLFAFASSAVALAPPHVSAAPSSFASSAAVAEPFTGSHNSRDADGIPN